MDERKKQPIELLGIIAIVMAAGLFAYSLIVPMDLPSPPQSMDPTLIERMDYQRALDEAQASIMAASRYQTISLWLLNLGGIAWIAGLILSIAEILRNKE